MKQCSILSATERLPLIFQIWFGLLGIILWNWTIAFVLMLSKLAHQLHFTLRFIDDLLF